MKNRNYRLLCLSLAVTLTLVAVIGCGSESSASEQVNIALDNSITVSDAGDASLEIAEESEQEKIVKNTETKIEDNKVEYDSTKITDELPRKESSNVDNQDTVDTTDSYVDEATTAKDIAVQNKLPKMSETQKNSLNMLNFLTVLTQEINESKGSRLYVENAYSSLLNNTYPNAVETRTQAQLTNILDTLEGYRMVDVKRERLEYIYEQNRAQAMRKAIPSPMSVLNVVQSRDLLKAAASVVYMAVDSYDSYSSYVAENDLEYLQDGWELDDEESAELHNSRKQAFTYMLSMVRENNLPGDYALNEESVNEFVIWKNNTNVVRKIAFFESNKSTYEAFGTYWLTLAESYYESGDYQKCLDSIEKYKEIASRIFRKDYDYAKVLPLGIVAAQEEYGIEEYIEVANRYAEDILENCDNYDWTLTYFVAQIYMDLNAKTKESSYMQKAYDIAYNNVNYLVDEQKNLNVEYLAESVEVDTPKGATKREKDEIKQYNKMLKVERKTALPPISEALYLNCDLLFALAHELNISSYDKEKVDSILHENGDSIFLMKEIDDCFWFGKKTLVKADEIEVSFVSDKLVIPAIYISANSLIKVTADNDGNKTVFDDWIISEVERKKNAECMEFTATFTSEQAKKFKYSDGMIISIVITPIVQEAEETLTFEYKAIGVKNFIVFEGIEFERERK